MSEAVGDHMSPRSVRMVLQMNTAARESDTARFKLVILLLFRPTQQGEIMISSVFFLTPLALTVSSYTYGRTLLLQLGKTFSLLRRVIVPLIPHKRNIRRYLMIRVNIHTLPRIGIELLLRACFPQCCPEGVRIGIYAETEGDRCTEQVEA